VVIIPVCLIGYRGSIPRKVAKQFAPVVQRMRIPCYERGDGGSIPSRGTKYANVAQMVEQRIENPCVTGSIPVFGTS
jgi:hypothetical protein